MHMGDTVLVSVSFIIIIVIIIIWRFNNISFEFIQHAASVAFSSQI